MKSGSFPHPSPDHTIRRGFHVVYPPHSAPLHQRVWRRIVNLFEEWRAVLSPEACERIYRFGMTLLVLLVVAFFWWLAQAVDITGNNTYTIHKSNRTGQIIRVLDPKGVEVKMPLEELAKVKHKDYVFVP